MNLDGVPLSLIRRQPGLRRALLQLVLESLTAEELDAIPRELLSRAVRELDPATRLQGTLLRYEDPTEPLPAEVWDLPL